VDLILLLAVAFSVVALTLLVLPLRGEVVAEAFEGRSELAAELSARRRLYGERPDPAVTLIPPSSTAVTHSTTRRRPMASVARPTRMSPSPRGARRTIATYSSYEDAERAVDSLSDQRFPVERVAIVGTGLRSVEQVLGRVTTGRAALTGAGQGALIGLFIALLFGLFFTGPGFLGLLAYLVIASAIFGAVFWAVWHAAQGGRRDFASVAGTYAESYELQADEEVADEAGRLLDRTRGNGSDSAAHATAPGAPQ
jgi:hypothetical protein